MFRMVFALCACVAASEGSADILATFDEGAPTDRFSIMNAGGCTITDVSLVVDLSGSQAGLIFDVTGEGAGVEVFQPLQMVQGEAALQTVPQLKDGDTQVKLSIRELAPGDAIIFTTDVDDTKGTRATMISGTEIEGARLVFEGMDTPEARFSTEARAQLPYDACAA